MRSGGHLGGGVILLDTYVYSAEVWVLRGHQMLSHKMFDLHFLLDSNPSGPLINRLKYFLIHF